MSAELHKLVDTVDDESSFLRFVAALAADWDEERRLESENPSSPYGTGAHGWESGSIGTFLESAHAWGESTSKGTEFYQVPANAWRRAAEILFAGKFYE